MTKKQLILRLKNLVLAPKKEWEVIAREERDGKEAIHQFSLPLIGFLTGASLLGILVNNQGFAVEFALKMALTDFLSAYGSVYLSAVLIHLVRHFFKWDSSYSQTFLFVGFAFGLTFAIKTITNLFPEFYMLRLLVLYTIYIVWEGVVPVFKIKDQQRHAFAMVCSVIILGIPFLLDYVLKLVIPGNSVL